MDHISSITAGAERLHVSTYWEELLKLSELSGFWHISYGQS